LHHWEQHGEISCLPALSHPGHVGIIPQSSHLVTTFSQYHRACVQVSFILFIDGPRASKKSHKVLPSSEKGKALNSKKKRKTVH
jgi:hypothetical protein